MALWLWLSLTFVSVFVVWLSFYSYDKRVKRQRIIVQGQMQQRVVNANNNNTVIYTIPSNSQPIRVLTTQNSQYVHPNNNMTHNYSSNVNPATDLPPSYQETVQVGPGTTTTTTTIRTS